jgi:hypothetical protein
MDDDDRVNHERALSSLSDVLPGLPERGRSTKWADSLSVTLYNRQRFLYIKCPFDVTRLAEINIFT